jgi:hypothetical protein
LPEAPPKAVSRRLPLALAIAGLAVAVGVMTYSGRRTLARDALTAWLRSKGVPAAAEIQAIGPTGVSGSLAIGDPRHPDFTAEKVELGYGLRGFNLEVRSIRLVRPVLRARLRGGRFSAGALDPLIEEFRKAPPSPNAAQPRIAMEGGRLLLATDAGPLQVDADATIEQGRLLRLAANIAPTRLRGRGLDANLGPVALSAQTVGGIVDLSLDAPITSATAGRLSAANARLRLKAAAPYPDLARKRAAGAVVAQAQIIGGRVALDGQAVRDGLISAALTGQASGWLDDLTLSGRATAELRANGGEGGGGTAGPLHAAATAEELRWTHKGGDSLSGRIAANATLASFTRPDANLAQLSLAARGPVALSAKRADFDLAASASGHAGWTGPGAPTAADSAEIAAVKRAAQGFRFAAPALAVRSSAGALSARLLQPVRLAPDRGGAVTLAPAGAGFRLTAAGGGLPKLNADIRRYAFTADGVTASGRIQAALSIGLVHGGEFDATGALRVAGGEVSFTGDRCAQVAAARLDFGQNDVEHFAGRLCPAGRPLISLNQGGWRIAGRAEEIAGEAPVQQARLAQGAGSIDLAGSASGVVLRAQARVDRVEVSDAAPQTRFRPVGVVGEASAAQGQWRSTLVIRDSAGRQLATARIRHEDKSGRGGMDVETGTLSFAQGGLQPAELSPLAVAIGPPAEGEAHFTGSFTWTPTVQASSGVLEVPHFEFQSPAGKVTGVSARMVFSNLAPLTAQPGQTLQAAEVAVPAAPLKDIRVTFGLQPTALEVASAQAAVGGGLARIASLEVPLSPDQPIHGVLELQGVQLHDLVKASPFGDRVDVAAKVSGRLPFTLEGNKVRVAGGKLEAIEPGRLSIQRTALTGVEASGALAAPGAPGAAAAPEASTDTFSDFAYQAMEHLAFTTLSASVDSRPDGRLRAVFHVIGKHDPPQHQEIRLPLFDLIGKKFLGRTLPLPSGTGVDLTLDTTLNLDDLMSDYAAFRRLHGSASVHPQAP